ncbi:Mur ligase family, catalytic domain protein [Parvimonas sp. oral taxon 393 str. F0440]|nr:Mur ligase family, catalytic domain protein [Parvimonas sp. oral taxon 393 str. F0440]
MFKFDFNDKKYKNIHFIGIGGISMSGIAKLLLKKGYNISGSDRNTSKEIQILEQNGAKIFIGQKRKILKILI